MCFFYTSCVHTCSTFARPGTYKTYSEYTGTTSLSFLSSSHIFVLFSMPFHSSSVFSTGVSPPHAWPHDPNVANLCCRVFVRTSRKKYKKESSTSLQQGKPSPLSIRKYQALYCCIPVLSWLHASQPITTTPIFFVVHRGSDRAQETRLKKKLKKVHFVFSERA